MNAKEPDKDNPADDQNKDDEQLDRLTKNDLLELLREERKEAHAQLIDLQREADQQQMELQREADLQQMQLHHESQRQERWWKYLSFFLSIVIGVAGFGLAWKSTMVTKEVANRAEYRQREAEVIRDDIAEKKKMMQVGSVKIRDMRLLNRELMLSCKYKHPYSMEKQKLLRMKSRDDVIKAFILSRFTFNNKVDEEIQKLAQFDSDTKDVCNASNYYDDRIRFYQRNVTDLMDKAIEEDLDKLKNLK